METSCLAPFDKILLFEWGYTSSCFPCFVHCSEVNWISPLLPLSTLQFQSGEEFTRTIADHGTASQAKRFTYVKYRYILVNFSHLFIRLYTALDTVTEPHQLTATLNCVTSVARALVQSNKSYSEGRSHVLPLIQLVLPGIDPNDFGKAMVSRKYDSILYWMLACGYSCFTSGASDRAPREKRFSWGALSEAPNVKQPVFTG